MLNPRSSWLMGAGTAGKDRTGLIAAMILALTGASKEEIARDYALTRVGIEPSREFLLTALLEQMGKEFNPEVMADPGMQALAGTNGLNILAVLDWMVEEWGAVGKGLEDGNGERLYPGVEGYMAKELGFKGEDVERIRRNLLMK
ncbi:hypothetical protein G7Y89_g14151 [Cudoniella acicularis]|uniref:Tyrosine specific protein phosphatases domain-containing protein n=1 Tax=Cudoniella acicularis TaxID=354080 RepID=A0A8H4R8D2_9HELO|nr:hypothetical protein G7Y89_g14151 [Cudoniella acicularis]